MKYRIENRRNSGFTLIELLVVIAIIAILAAILFPVFAKAREKARQITCASNEKQIGLAIIQYVQDYDEKFPAGAPGTAAIGLGNTTNNGGGFGAGLGGQGWVGNIMPYAKSTGVFHCPDDSEDTASGTNGNTLYPVSYGLNENLPTETLAYLVSPATTVLVSEMTGVQAYINYPDEGLSEGLKPTQLSPTTSAWMANGCGNGCGGLDSPGADAWSGVKLGTVGGSTQVTGAAGSAATNAVAGPQARHDPQVASQSNGPGAQGGSEWLLADGHVKFIRWQYVETGTGGTYVNSQLGNTNGNTYGYDINPQ